VDHRIAADELGDGSAPLGKYAREDDRGGVMNKAGWDKLKAFEKNCLVSSRVFEVQAGCVEEMGKPVMYWVNGEGRQEVLPNFTADRNACALVLDELEKLGDDTIFRFLDVFKKRCDITQARGDLRQAAWFGMRAQSDLICYCAVKSVTDDDR